MLSLAGKQELVPAVLYLAFPSPPRDHTVNDLLRLLEDFSLTWWILRYSKSLDPPLYHLGYELLPLVIEDVVRGAIIVENLFDGPPLIINS